MLPATCAHRPQHPLSGRWASAEVIGLDELLEALNVPAMARSLARKMQRTLCIEVRDGRISISTSTIVVRRTLEDSTVTFRVGEPFRGQLPMGGPFEGTARWTSPERTGGPLLVEKRIAVMGRSVVLEETYSATPDGRLSVETCIKGQGELELEVASAADRDLLCRSLDQRSLRVKKDVDLSGGR